MGELRAGLLQACDDRRLFGFELWPRQRELLEAVERGPRIHCWAIGRRSGKSTLAAVICLWDCLLRPDVDRLVRPGESRFAVCVATNLAQARLVVRAAHSIVERSPVLAGLIDGLTEDEIRFRLPSGARTVLRAFPCSSRGGRGWPVSTLVLDEGAHFLSESDGDRAAERVWEALAPSTAQFGDSARIVLSSTPYGSSGLFHDLWTRANDGELQDAHAEHATTAQVNPTIAEAFLELEQARDPDSFRAEYLAEFTSSGDAFIDFDRIDVAGVPTGGPKAARTWVAGLDPAFAKDPFGVALVGRTTDGMLICGPVRAFRARGEFAGPVDEVARIAKEYHARAVTDQFSSAAVLDRLRNTRGIGVRVRNMTAQSKSEIFQALRARLYDQSLLLPDNPGLVAELRRLRTKYSSGQASVVNPRVGGSHGDMAQALAMAVYELARTARVTRAPFFSEPPEASRWAMLRPGQSLDGM